MSDRPVRPPLTETSWADLVYRVEKLEELVRHLIDSKADAVQ